MLADQVFDIFKPGSKVARSKRQFPDAMYHLALAIGKPPDLQVSDWVVMRWREV